MILRKSTPGMLSLFIGPCKPGETTAMFLTVKSYVILLLRLSGFHRRI